MEKSAPNDLEVGKEEDPSENLLQSGWIPKDEITGFSAYQYISPTKTYFEDQILDKLWEAMMVCIPMNIAPNLITVSGLVIVFIGIL